MSQNAKEFVEAAIRRRDSESLPGASDVWRLSVTIFAYLRQLDDHELKFLRRHTFHFTGDNYQRYLFGNKDDKGSILGQMKEALARLPGFAIGEAEHGIGYETPYGLVSSDLVRYVSVVADLAESGAIDKTDRKILLEIGGGYGGLARTTLMYAPSCSYIVCDLEETLFCSAVYLTNAFGAERVHLVDGGIDTATMQPGHFYVLPQIDLERISGRIDIAMNQQSMQEMERRQVDRYCDFFGRQVGQFYSRNYPSLDSIENVSFLSDFNLVKDLNELLKSRFPVVWRRAPEPSGVGDDRLERLVLRCL